MHSAPPVSDSAPRRRAFATRWAGERAHYTMACADPSPCARPPPHRPLANAASTVLCSQEEVRADAELGNLHKLAALPCGCYASLAGSCWLQGYPNFDCGLEEGAPLTCKAFPLLWPPQAAAAAGYKGLAAERLAPMLTLQPSAGYAKVRQAQASTYSTAAGGGG